MKWQAEVDVPAFGEDRGNFDQIEVEDGGGALIYCVEREAGNEGFYVQLRSWNDGPDRIRNYEAERLAEAHPEFAQFAGKRIRVTVETVE
jgi:hypothetical protein